MFADATELVYVVDSAVEGAMREEFLPFSSREEASAFADEHGGEVQPWEKLGGRRVRSAYRSGNAHPRPSATRARDADYR